MTFTALVLHKDELTVCYEPWSLVIELCDMVKGFAPDILHLHYFGHSRDNAGEMADPKLSIAFTVLDPMPKAATFLRHRYWNFKTCSNWQKCVR